MSEQSARGDERPTAASEEFVGATMKVKDVGIEQPEDLLKVRILCECCRELVKARHRLADHRVGIY